MHLDKDILIKGNKIYSPSTCCFVPQNINVLFTKRESERGLYPIGVHLHSQGGYGASCNDGSGNNEQLGVYKTPKIAFDKYKYHKEKLIKEIAVKYHKFIPNNVYNALIQYKVEITD